MKSSMIQKETILVCNYAPSWDGMALYLYKNGKPCSGCSVEERCENDLCVYDPLKHKNMVHNNIFTFPTFSTTRWYRLKRTV